jgi:putative transcriptional regulator
MTLQTEKVIYNLPTWNIYITRQGDCPVENHVKKFRTEKNLSQKELADYAGITRQTLSLIEKSEYNPSLKLCLQLCYALNKTLDDVFWIEQSEGETENEKN